MTYDYMRPAKPVACPVCIRWRAVAPCAFHAKGYRLTAGWMVDHLTEHARHL